VQENVIHGGLHATDRSRLPSAPHHQPPRQRIDQDQRLNRALWLLAETLAKHKTA